MEAKRKIRQGRVIGNKMDKTITVLVETRRRHPRYKRIVTYRTAFKAHDESNECNIGDIVRICETRPLSKYKRWRVTDIVSKADIIVLKPTEIE